MISDLIIYKTMVLYTLQRVWKKKLFVAFPWEVTRLSAGPGGFMISVFIICREHPKAQPKVVLWRSRESSLRPLVYNTWVYPLHHGGFPATCLVGGGWI